MFQILPFLEENTRISWLQVIHRKISIFHFGSLFRTPHLAKSHSKKRKIISPHKANFSIVCMTSGWFSFLLFYSLLFFFPYFCSFLLPRVEMIWLPCTRALSLFEPKLVIQTGANPSVLNGPLFFLKSSIVKLHLHRLYHKNNNL